MRRTVQALSCSVIATLWLASTALAQTPPASGAPGVTQTPQTLPKLWFVAGVASTTVKGDCQTCEEEAPYRHTSGVLANVGYRTNERMDVGAEILWVPASSSSGRIRSLHFDAVAQFRPWATHGFFVKGGAGMAFVRNWIDATGGTAINSKALSVVIGTGWAFRRTSRIGWQLFGSQHVAALGDLVTADAEVPDVVGNFWSFGGALVIR